jgi:hypothetical protein
MTNECNRETRNPSSLPCAISGRGGLMFTNGKEKDVELVVGYIHMEEMR